MGSASAPKQNSWRNPMAKVSLVHRFTQVLLNPSKDQASKTRDHQEDESSPPSASKPTSPQWRRRRLEMDVVRLQEKLQQETDLHCALQRAITQAAGAFSSSFPQNLPVDAQELLAEVALLELAVSNLEEQMVGLEIQIQYERNERLRNSACQTASSPLLSRRRGSRHIGRIEDPACEATDLTDRLSLPETLAEASMDALCEDDIAQSNYSQPCTSASEITSSREEDAASARSSNSYKEECTTSSLQDRHIESGVEDSKNGSDISLECATSNEVGGDLSHTSLRDKNSLADEGGASSSSDSSLLDKLWRQPNKLSQEMVSCMIGIYCHLADPSEGGRHIISDNVPSPSSPFGHVTSSSFSSLSDLSSLSFARSPSSEIKVKDEQDARHSTMDPYRTHEKLEWGDIGRYSSAVEVSWMAVGKEQLEYAADALRIFRSLVEQLSRVDATALGHDEKLAFWINIYNALMMHAYLAYGVPKNDVKYFALMQKAAYTVGGHFFNAMAIEHVLLRGKAPSYRPQIALLLALHKVKIPEGALRFAISRPEPLVIFALSCGAWSSPAVRIYSPDNVHTQLQAALHDYVRASVGVSQHGKVLLPKLLHCYARDLNMLQAKGEMDEGRVFVLWLSSFLPTHQANLVRDAVQKRAGHPPPPTTTIISVQPFSYRLRYLFLHQC